MIKNSEVLSMAEAIEFIKKDEEKETDIVGFIKKFNKLKSKDAKELKQEIERMDIIKIKPEYVVKIIDILPDSPEELNKIFVDVSLDEDETKKVLDAIKKFK
jgi:DNA-directed RNA polymerase subunit F